MSTGGQELVSASCRRLQAQVCDHQALLPLLSPGYFICSVNSGHTMYQALRLTISQQRAPSFWNSPRLAYRLQGLDIGWVAWFGQKQRS